MPLENELVKVREALARRDSAALWERARSADRDVRKAAKRALYLMKSQGFETSAPPAVVVRADTPPSVPAEESESCHISAPDAAGEQLILIPRKESKGYRLFQAMTSDAAGVTAFDQLDVSRRLLRQILADLGRRGLETRPVSRPEAIVLLAEAIRLAPERPAALQAAHELRELSDADLAPTGTAEANGLADSARLFESPALRGYLPEAEVLRETLARLEAAAASPLQLSERQRGDQLKRTMERAIDGYFDGRQRARYARRLRGLGSWFLAGGEAEQAGRAFAAAEQLASEQPALLNPFARTLFERAFIPPERPREETGQPSATPLILSPPR